MRGKKCLAGTRRTGEAGAAIGETVRGGETWHEGGTGVLLSPSCRQITHMCDGSAGSEGPGTPECPGTRERAAPEIIPVRSPPWSGWRASIAGPAAR